MGRASREAIFLPAQGGDRRRTPVLLLAGQLIYSLLSGSRQLISFLLLGLAGELIFHPPPVEGGSALIPLPG